MLGHSSRSVSPIRIFHPARKEDHAWGVRLFTTSYGGLTSVVQTRSEESQRNFAQTESSIAKMHP